MTKATLSLQLQINKKAGPGRKDPRLRLSWNPAGWATKLPMGKKWVKSRWEEMEMLVGS